MTGTGRVLALAAALVLAAAGGARAAERYALDTQHTEVRFVWNHLGLSRQSAEFRAFEGSLLFDRDDVSKSALEVAVQTRSIASGVPELDQRFMEEDMFDAASHPVITFKSTEVKRIGARRGRVVGDLTIKGIARRVAFDVDLNYDGEHPLAPFLDAYKGARYTAFSARGTVLRSNFEMSFGLPLISDEVQIVIETEMRQEK